MASKKIQDELALEVTVLSAESLKKPSSFLFPSFRLRSYVVLSSAATSAIHRTRVDESGSHNPTWADTMLIPLDPSSFFKAGGGNGDPYAGVHVSVLSKRCPLKHPKQLGWCRISPADVLDGLHPPTTWRRLSYALRVGIYGGRGCGIIHVSVRLVGNALERTAPQPRVAAPDAWLGRAVLGIPVALPVAECGPRGSRSGDAIFWRGF